MQGSFLSGQAYSESTSKDPFVKVRLGTLSLETDAVNDSLEPVWDRRYGWPLAEFVAALEGRGNALDIKVGNKNLFKNSFMGGYIAPPNEVWEWLDSAVPASLARASGGRSGGYADAARALKLTDVAGDDRVVTRTFALVDKKTYKRQAKVKASLRERAYANGNPGLGYRRRVETGGDGGEGESGGGKKVGGKKVGKKKGKKKKGGGKKKKSSAKKKKKSSAKKKKRSAKKKKRGKKKSRKRVGRRRESDRLYPEFSFSDEEQEEEEEEAGSLSASYSGSSSVGSEGMGEGEWEFVAPGEEDKEKYVGAVVLALSLGLPPVSTRSAVSQSQQLERINSALGPGSDLEAKIDSHGRVFYCNHSARTVSYTAPPYLASALERTESLASTGDVGSSFFSVGDETWEASVTSTDSESGSEDSFSGATTGSSSAGEESEDPNAYPGAPEWWKSKALGPLPPGWEVGNRMSDKPYFINHASHQTTWDDPRVPPRDMAGVDPDLQTVLVMDAALSDGWERRVSAGGTLYYIQAALDVSSWTPPDAEFNEVEALRDETRGAFPPGWERKIMADGSVFYVNHLSKSTTWNDPRLEEENNNRAGPSSGGSRLNSSSGSASGGRVRPNVSDFQTKLDALRDALPSESGETQITVGRDRMFEDAYDQIMRISKRDLKKYFRVTFRGEAGLDYGGLSREFFTQLSASMFSPFYGLFEYCGSDTGTLQINAQSGLAADDHLRLFRFIGRTIGLAIRNGKLMEAYFTPAFYKHVLRRPGTLHDMQSYDLEIYNSLEWVSTNSIENILFETFSVVENVFGVERVVDLLPNGRNIDVTDSNKARYVGLLMNYYLFDSVEEQMDALRTGISDVFDLDLLTAFDSNQLEYLISGLGEIDVDDWEANTEYGAPYSATHQNIIWFWEIVREYSDEERARVLSFATGTSRVPLGGFAHLIGSNGPRKFNIKSLDGVDKLALSHSCFNSLHMPVYPSKSVLRSKLTMSVMESAGFSIE